MAEQELNKLNVKSDSLPDNWLVTVINPVTGTIAENMKLGRFVELLIEKIPLANWSSGGLQSPYQGINSIKIEAGETYNTGNLSYGCYLITNHTKNGSSCIIDNAWGKEYYQIPFKGEGFSDTDISNHLYIHKEQNGLSFSIKNNMGVSVEVRINRL